MMTSEQWLPAWTVGDLLLRLPFKRSTRADPVPWRIRLGTFNVPGTQQAAISIWDRALLELQNRLRTLEWAITALRNVQSPGIERTAANALLQQLRFAGFWDGVTALRETLQECRFLREHSARIIGEHPTSREEGVELARARQDEEDE